MSEWSSQSQASQSDFETEPYTKLHTVNNVKASGVCSRCLAVRQLHLRDGSVHVHGPRYNPCPGSRLPPLTTTPTQGQVRDDGGAEGQRAMSMPLLHTDSVNETTTGTGTVEKDNVDGDISVSANMIRHPSQRGSGIMKHIPRGARFACCRALIDIMHSIIDNPSSIEQWSRLLCFASNILAQPKRSGRRRNMANVVKKRIDNREFQRTDAGEEQNEGCNRKCASERDLFLAAVNAKLEDGNIKAATRILCSQDYPVKATSETFAAMQEKHPSDKWSSNLSELPDAAQSTPYQASEKEVADAMRSFPAGSAGGPDGLRPQHLLDLLNNKESSESFLQALTGFINVLLRGECPKGMRELVFGGTLIALSKKSGGLRPIAIGYALRRLAAKCANSHALGRLESFFTPLQVGVAVPGGGEAAVHGARSFVTNMTEDEIFVKLDFTNAFNTLRRDVMLQMVYDTIPEIYAFTHQAYSAESQLQFGSFVVRSMMGPQQGDPLGPLLFCLPLQPVLRAMRSSFRLGYLDDISLGGKKEDVLHDLTSIKDLESSLGICLNSKKCELYSKTEQTEPEFEGFERLNMESLLLLGAPLFRGEALDVALLRHSEILERASTDLACLRAQSALILLRASFGAAKLTYLLRTSPCHGHPLLEKMDDQMRKGLENIINISLNNIQWLQATLPIRDGGLGVRRVSMLASSAYLASAASTKSLVSLILCKEEWDDVYFDELLEVRKNTQPSSAEPMLNRQSVWDSPLIEADRATVWAAYSDPVNMARLFAVTSPHAGDWLLAIPVTACGLDLSNEAIRVAVGLRLGLDLCTPHQCQCGETADSRGHHGLVCRRSSGRTARHFAVNDLVWRALAKANIPSSKEPPGLIRTDGKRPDGATLVPWARGKYIAWDFTAIHTCAVSYLHLSSTVSGGAAEHAADRKCNKYSSLPVSHEFVPIAIETLGPINSAGREFLLELGRRCAAVSGDPRETVYLFQRLSICTQRFNAVAYRGTFAPLPGDDINALYA